MTIELTFMQGEFDAHNRMNVGSLAVIYLQYHVNGADRK